MRKKISFEAKLIIPENFTGNWKDLIPQYATSLSVGLDLYARTLQDIYAGNQKYKNPMKNVDSEGIVTLKGFERGLFGTGLCFSLPQEYEFQIRSRSGLALKQRLIVMNQPGTIDSDYTGEIKIILYNSTPYPNKIKLGDRIAQGVLAKIASISNLYFDRDLAETERGDGGFGHTGK